MRTPARLAATSAATAVLAVAAIAATVVPEVDTTTGALSPPALEARLAGAYADSTNSLTLAKGYADSQIAVNVGPLANTNLLNSKVAAAILSAQQAAGASAAVARAQAQGDIAVSNAAALAQVASLYLPSNGIATAAVTVTGAQSNLVASALQAEADTLASTTARGASTTNSVIIGSDSTATGVSAFAQGNTVAASGNYSTAAGAGTTAQGLASHAEGDQTLASGPSSHAEGKETFATGEASHAEGNASAATGDYAHAEGGGTQASGEASHAEGTITKAVGDYSHAAGHFATAEHVASYAWGGTTEALDGDEYVSHGAGTFNVNPVGGVDGFWIGEQTLGNLLSAPPTPTWNDVTNLAATVTATNVYERPLLLTLQGTASVSFAELRSPLPLYCVLRGADAVTFPGAHVVGGGSWQTNAANHFIVWSYGTNTFVSPVTASY